MLRVFKHTFNLFQENTYVVADETNQCAIIDPGCNDDYERSELVKTIEANGLTPVLLLNTHCHIDHFPGNKFLCDKYQLLPQFHETEWLVMKQALDFQSFFNFTCEASPKPAKFLKEGDEVKFGSTSLKVFFTPGHSPGHLSFYSEADKKVFSGDVLFQGSVGRFDLPGASGDVLFNSIKTKLLTLPDDVVVYSGHGPETTIGVEKKTNPFLQGQSAFFN